MKLYSFDIPNSHYEHTFDSEEYEKAPDKDGFCFTGPFVYWEDHKQALARIAELEKQLLARGGHNSDCQFSWKGECYCGWEEMKKSLMER